MIGEHLTRGRRHAISEKLDLTRYSRLAARQTTILLSWLLLNNPLLLSLMLSVSNCTVIFDYSRLAEPYESRVHLAPGMHLGLV